MRAELQAIQSAWVKGALLTMLIVVVDIIARKMGMSGSDMLLYIVWGLFMVAVFITTFAAPRHKLITGMSHTVTISLLFALSSWAQSALGGVDLSGDKGFGVVFALIYVTSFIPALIASVAGLLLSGKKEEKRG